jgi:thiol:disulfide interchange protein
MKSRALLLVAISAALSAQAPYAPVDEYNPGRDAARDLREAVAEAARSHRNVLVDVGGTWCIWCRYMDEFYASHPDIQSLRDRNYVQVKLNFSPENENKDVLNQYPKIPGYPHLFVIDGKGKLLRSQGTAELEQGSSYNPQKFKAFLEKWAPR